MKCKYTIVFAALVFCSAGFAQEGAYKFRASDLLGTTVENADGDNIGEVDDLIITDGDDILQAVLSVGGFLGVGDKLITVPYQQLWITKDEDGDLSVKLDASEEQLEAQDEFIYNEGELSWKSREEQRREQLRSELQEELEEAREALMEAEVEKEDVQEIREKLDKID